MKSKKVIRIKTRVPSLENQLRELNMTAALRSKVLVIVKRWRWRREKALQLAA